MPRVVKGGDAIPNLFRSVFSGVLPMKRSDRVMKYPYTYAAKVAQFPYAYYWKNNFLFRYWLIGTLLTVPIAYKIQKLSYAPANVEVWDKKRKEMFDGTAH